MNPHVLFSPFQGMGSHGSVLNANYLSRLAFLCAERSEILVLHILLAMHSNSSIN
jgi:hypothetical protein